MSRKIRKRSIPDVRVPTLELSLVRNIDTSDNNSRNDMVKQLRREEQSVHRLPPQRPTA
jgi:hypothetical protein